MRAEHQQRLPTKFCTNLYLLPCSLVYRIVCAYNSIYSDLRFSVLLHPVLLYPYTLLHLFVAFVREQDGKDTCLLGDSVVSQDPNLVCLGIHASFIRNIYILLI